MGAVDDTFGPLLSSADPGQLIRELLGLLGKGHAEKAARLYALAPPQVGFALIERLSSADSGSQETLGKMFHLARDYYRAAIVYEGIRLYEKAGELYEQAGELQSAAELMEKLGRGEEAAELFERAGIHGKAGELYADQGRFAAAARSYERARRPVRAAHHLCLLGQHERALELVARIGPGDFDYVEGVVLAAQLLRHAGRPQAALDRLERAVAELALDERSQPLYQLLFVLSLERGNRERAKALQAQLGQSGLSPREDPPLEPPLAEAPAPSAEHRAAPMAPAAAPSATATPVTEEALEDLEFLQGTSLFRTLTLPEVQILYRALRRRLVTPGGVLIEQGRPGQALFVLKEGTVEVQQTTAWGHQAVATLGPGAHFGEMALLDPHADTSARVVAREPLQVFEITRERFLQLVRMDLSLKAKLYEVFVETLCQRLRATMADLVRLREGRGP